MLSSRNDSTEYVVLFLCSWVVSYSGILTSNPVVRRTSQRAGAAAGCLGGTRGMDVLAEANHHDLPGRIQCTQGRVWVLALSSLQRAGVQVARHSPHEAGGDVCAVTARSGAAPGELLPKKTSETHLTRVVAACLPCRKYLNRL